MSWANDTQNPIQAAAFNQAPAQEAPRGQEAQADAQEPEEAEEEGGKLLGRV